MSTEEQLSQIKGVESIRNVYDNNKKNINIAAIAAIILMAGIWYYYKMYKPGFEKDANESFFMAARYYDTDSLNQSLNGDGINLGMLDIADEFGSTKSGQLATYYAGRILLQQGKFDEALEYLEDVSFSDEILAAQAITLAGDCYSELGDYSKAGDVYMDAANKRENDLTTPLALRKAGEAYEEAGELEDALDAFVELNENYIQSRDAINSEAKIARVKAKMAAN